MSPPPPLWFRALLAATGLGSLAYQRLLPEPVATFAASPLATAWTGRPTATPPDADAFLLAIVPIAVGLILAATALRRKAGVVALLWRGGVGVIGSLLVLIWCSFLVPTLWPTSAVLLAGAAASAWGLRRADLDTGGLGAALLFVAATVTSHFFVPLSNLAGGSLRPVALGLVAGLALWGGMRARPFAWHAPPRLARSFAAFCAAAMATSVAGYFDVDEEVYGCVPPDPADCPYDDPRLTWLERDTDAVYYGLHLDPPRQQVIALARARYCDDGTTATATFFGLDGAVHARVPIPDCDRAYAAGRPDRDRLLPVCASGLQSLDLQNRTLTTPPLERFTDFEAETAIERPDGSWWLSGVDQGLIARFDPVTLQETERWWVADSLHLAGRLEALDFVEPGLFLFASSTSVQVLDADFNLRARRETVGVNVFLAVDPGRRLVYVPDTARRRLRVWTLPELEPHADVPIDEGAYVAFHSPELGLLGTSHFKGSTITLHDADTLEPRGTLQAGPGPRGGVFDPATRRLIATSRCGVFAVDVDAIGRALSASSRGSGSHRLD